MPAKRVTLITGGTVVTGGRDSRAIENGAVAVSGNRIADVGPKSEVAPRHTEAAIVEAAGKLVMPGLVNAHTHLYSSLARGLMASLAPARSFVETLETLWWRLDRALTEDDVRTSAAVGAIDLIRNGTTTILDHHSSQSVVRGSLSAVGDALSDVGLRANLCFETTDRNGQAARNAALSENERFAREAGAAKGAMLTASVGLHASFTVSDQTLDRAAALARELGVGCHIHAAEDVADLRDSLSRSGQRVVGRLAAHGVLGGRTVAAHCVHTDEREWTILRDTGTIVAHNPRSNMNNAVGCAPVPRMLDAGVLLGLGTDGFSASLFDEMKVADLIHRHESGDPRMGHDVARRLCLENNAEIASRLFDDRLGVLERGALADLIVLDYEPPTPIEDGNAAAHVLFGLSGAMVESVMVNGSFVMKERAFVALDVRSVFARARERARALWSRM